MPGVGEIPRGEVRAMTAMTRRERILATSQKKQGDRLPFFHWWRHLQIGWAERECRNRGMGLAWDRPCYVTRIHNVVITEEKSPSHPGVTRITYSTPRGRVYMDERRDPGTGQWHEQRSWRDVSPWAIKRLIREPEDYEIVKYIVENTEYLPDYFPVEQAKEWVGPEGVVLASLHKTPMARLMIEWIGSEEGRFYIHHKKYKDQLEDLYRAMCQSMEPLYEIAAKSPADLVWMGENTEGFLVSPPLFETYFMPVYEKCARVFHEHGKMMAVHMDGRLNVLKNLIANTPIDIIEAFHPPPMGDLALSEALAVWKEKVIWMGFPAAIYSLGSAAVKDYTLELLGSVVPGERLAIAMSTENLVTDEHLRLLTSILENAELPLTEEKVKRISSSLS
jgi:hypothetical protein